MRSVRRGEGVMGAAVADRWAYRAGGPLSGYCGFWMACLFHSAMV